MKIGVIGAEKHEVELLYAALRESDSPVHMRGRGLLEFHEGRLDGVPTIVVCCGIGKVNAALCAQALISDYAVDVIINTGSAGGLAEGLAVLDMVVSTDAVQHDVDATVFGYLPGQVPGTKTPFFVADAGLRARAIAAHARVAKSGKMVEGRVASGDSFINDVARRSRIVELFGPACVEMEGAAIAQVCASNNVPFVILRSISDLAGQDAGMSYDEFAKFSSFVSASVVREMVASLRPEEEGK